MPDHIRRKRRRKPTERRNEDAGFNPAEKKKGEWMATGIMDDGDAGFNPAEWTQKMPAYNDGEMDEEKDGEKDE